MADPLRPPLHGVRVLELAHLIAGPICGMYLADMGADVVKVESREAPDAGRSGAPVADTLGGMLAIQGILTALIARAASGQGQRVDASLLNGMLFAHTARLSVFHETGLALPRYGSGHPEIVPYQAFQGADGWLFVAAWVDRLWLPFCKAVGMDALGSDPRFATRKDRPPPPGGRGA